MNEVEFDLGNQTLRCHHIRTLNMWSRSHSTDPKPDLCFASSFISFAPMNSGLSCLISFSSCNLAYIWSCPLETPGSSLPLYSICLYPSNLALLPD